MGNLPSNTFLFNYNAKDYDNSTRTIVKTNGQLYNYDIVLNGYPNSYDDVSIDFSNGNLYCNTELYTTSTNPFNRVSSASTFTFIYKTSGFTDGSTNIFGNRFGSYNYMVRGSMLHTASSGFLSLIPSTHPEICVIRIKSNGESERKFVDVSGNTLQITTASSITWGSESRAGCFFGGYYYGGEYFTDRFYWMYCSTETLTDEEVLKVIQFNEGIEPTPPQPYDTKIVPINKLYYNGNRLN